MSEFSRIYDVHHLPTGPVMLEADAQERAALAARFGLVAVSSLRAELTLTAQGKAVIAAGRLSAAIVQSCAVSAEDLPVTIDEPVNLRFVPEDAALPTAAEVELDNDALDEIAMDGERFDLGEALAQSLALAIDPFATGPEADRVRQQAGLLDEGAAGPFAALSALRPKGNE